jgi:mannose-6-phosphate isomerase-like protein (cupin superfamily)
MRNKGQKTQTYRFQGHSGYLIHPTLGSTHTRLALGHTAGLDPWQDNGLHLHHTAEEGFLLLGGRLDFVVANCLITLHPNEFLLIRPGVPHAIVGGQGKIEHFGIRAPAVKDKQEIGPLPQGLKPSYEDDRLVIQEWGTRIPLAQSQHQKDMFTRTGKAFFTSHCLSLGYFNIPTVDVADFYLQPCQGLSIPWELWDYFLVFQGSKTLRIEEELITIRAGELLEVPPHLKPTPYHIDVPCRGIIISVPAAETHRGDKHE